MGYNGFEDGGVFPLATRYAVPSEVGASDHSLPESQPTELNEAMAADDSSSNGVFDDGHNLHTELGVFADNAALPGYAFRENGFGPSETVDWQLNTPVQVFASGIYNTVADAGIFPNVRGPEYLPQARGMADTDFSRPPVPSVSIANRSGIVADPVASARGRSPGPMTVLRDPRAPVSGFGSATSQALMSRRLLQVARPGVADIVARRGGYPDGQAYHGVGAIDIPSFPTWQYAVLGVLAGAVIGTAASIAFPSKSRR